MSQVSWNGFTLEARRQARPVREYDRLGKGECPVLAISRANALSGSYRE